MSGDEPLSFEEEFASALAACDEALEAGADPPWRGAPAELRDRLERGLSCMRLLREVLTQPDAPTVPAAPGTGLPLPSKLGRFEVRRELGRGGFGVVYLAYDPQLRREVALKAPRGDVPLTPEFRGRFLCEARAAAGLDHPNIVPVYEAGEAGAVCYIASAYCPGGTLAERLKERPGPAPGPEAAALVAALAAAVEHAHSRGVLHRDLKPANVMLESPPGGLLADPDRGDGGLGFVPRLTDFGLAKLLADNEEKGWTQSGAILGTPSYMAPEQAAGRNRAVGPAADVYALGAILYELLTGRPPFRAETAIDTLMQVRQQEPRPPRALNRRVDRGLEAICLKCLEKDPRRRYESAQALADDLTSWQAGGPIRARPRPWYARLTRALRRPVFRKTAVGALAGLSVLLAILAVCVLLITKPPPPERDPWQEQWEAIQRDLEAGKPVTLIGESGRPAHFCWLPPGRNANWDLAEDGTFFISHHEHGLLELLPDPHMDRYRFRAEVRHDQSPSSMESEAGIYFAHSEYAAANGSAHCYAKVAINDLVDYTRAFPNGGLVSNPVWLCVHRQPSTGLQRDSAQFGDGKEPFAFPQPDQRPWRQLAVEVTPERIRVFCGDQCIAEPSRAELLAWRKGMARSALDPLAEEPALAPRDGLGLYVGQGAASFRSVVIEPLTTND
jgi:serine/threonine-protein kinase